MPRKYYYSCSNYLILKKFVFVSWNTFKCFKNVVRKEKIILLKNKIINDLIVSVFASNFYF